MLKVGNKRRLFLVNGYSSHMNVKFIDYYDTHRILLLILPLYFTHRL